MGTNYYIDFKECECCGHAKGSYHIGKSSAGWCFSLHVDPENGISSLDDILELCKTGLHIVDEYGIKITVDEMVSVITDRSWGEREAKPRGYASWNEFHQLNSSEFGPNNLMRHKINKDRCVGHGPGTYDYIVGEFF